MLLQMALFLSFYGWIIFHCIYVPHFFIHSSVDGHLCCFHFLAIVNSTAMNIGVHVSFRIMFFSGYMPGSGIVGSLLLLFSHLVVSNSLQLHGLQHSRPPCPSPSLRVCPRSCSSHPLMPSSPALNLSQHQELFQWVICLYQMTKILELQLQLQSFQWIFWFDLLAVQGTFRSLIQHHRWKASILWHSAFW